MIRIGRNVPLLFSFPSFIIATILIAFPVETSANGGPVAWTGTTPVGAVGLDPDTNIRLQAESLRIKLNDDFNTYRVKAVYRLENPAGTKTVLFGVPLSWPNESEVVDRPVNNKGSADKAKKIAASIIITLNDIKLPCTLSPATAFPKESIVLPPGPAGEDQLVNAWCVASLPFPAQAMSTLTLEYSAELYYEDMVFTKSALTEFGERKLLYLFYPAGYWAGPAKTVDISVNAGPYTAFEIKKGPQGQKVDGRTVTWSLKDVDLKKIASLEMTFASDVLSKKEMLSWNKKASANEKIPLKASASSSLSNMGNVSYQPENVLDGRGETAWCEGVHGAGEGQWLQFNLMGTLPGKYCRIEGFAITPGYVKNQKVYLENGKIRKLQITDCEGKRPHLFTIKLSQSYLEAPQLLQMPVVEKKIKTGFMSMKTEYLYPLSYIEETQCFRLQILEVEKGSSDDSCISEVAVVINCG